MKVLNIINSLATGGAEKLLIETIPLYLKNEIVVDLLVLDGSEYPFMKQLHKYSNVNIYALGVKCIYNPINTVKIIPYLKKYDIVHVHLFPSLYWVALAKILSLSSITLIFTEHSTSNRRIQNKICTLVERFVYRLYDRVVCISPQVRDVLLQHLGRNEDELIIIENGVNLLRFQSSNDLSRPKLSNNIYESDILLIMVAGFRIQKDHETLLKSLVLLDNKIKLLLVGDGERKQEIEQSISLKGLSERVFLLGVRMDIPQLIKTCDIAILSSYWEGFGLVAVEGMASGKPFIASDVPGLREVVQGAGVLFPQGNEKILADEIMKLINNKQYYNEVSEKCIKRAAQYDINVMVNKTIELYKSIMAERK
jgi:glycosyltransferase involved in cell wall biosynthesis